MSDFATIAVKLLRDCNGVNCGEVAGFTLDVAERLVSEKKATYLDGDIDIRVKSTHKIALDAFNKASKASVASRELATHAVKDAELLELATDEAKADLDVAQKALDAAQALAMPVLPDPQKTIEVEEKPVKRNKPRFKRAKKSE